MGNLMIGCPYFYGRFNLETDFKKYDFWCLKELCNSFYNKENCEQSFLI